MQINLNVEPTVMERIAKALESIAHNLNLLTPQQPSGDVQTTPFGPEYFSRADNISTYQRELEDFLENKGYGKEYTERLEAEAFRSFQETPGPKTP